MKGLTFLLLSLVLVGIDVAIPYGLIGHIPSFAASFLFWSVLVLVAIVAAGWYIRGWGDKR